MFDRETRREKIIEAKQREQKLKTKSSAKADTTTTTKDKQAQLAESEARMVQEAGKEFEELVEKLVGGRTRVFPEKCVSAIRAERNVAKLYF